MNAYTLFESASMGPEAYDAGDPICAYQYLSVKFTLNTRTELTAVGGNIGTWSTSSQTIFAAILPLAAGALHPNGDPFQDADVLGFTTFTLNEWNRDVRTPLDLTLPAGDYALVFGSGRFGATGQGYMPDNNVVIPGVTANVAFWGPANARWCDFSPSGPIFMRFVIEAVPEPSSLALLALGGVVMLLKQKAEL